MNRAAPLQFAADEQAPGTLPRRWPTRPPCRRLRPSSPSSPTPWTTNLRRLLQEPSLVRAALNAQLRLRSIAGLPLSTRLIGRARIYGGCRIVLGERVFILGGTVPVEIAALGTGRIEIGEGTSINYGASLAAYELVSIGRMCRIGQYAIINDNDFHDIEDKQKLPPSKPVVIEDGAGLAPASLSRRVHRPRCRRRVRGHTRHSTAMRCRRYAGARRTLVLNAVLRVSRRSRSWYRPSTGEHARRPPRPPTRARRRRTVRSHRLGGRLKRRYIPGCCPSSKSTAPHGTAQPKNTGPAAARNRAINAASGDVLLFLDDDVVPEPGLIARHVNVHREHAGAVVIGPMLAPSSGLSPWLRWEAVMLMKQYTAMSAGEYRASARQFYTANASVRRQHVLRAGGFDERLRRAEDVELAYRLTGAGLNFYFVPDAAVLHEPDRTFASWLRVGYEYGRQDVVMTQSCGHTDILPRAYREWPERNALESPLHPPLRGPSAAPAGCDQVSADALAAHRSLAPETVQMPWSCSAPFNMHYWQGVADASGPGANVWEPLKGDRAASRLSLADLPSPRRTSLLDRTNVRKQAGLVLADPGATSKTPHVASVRATPGHDVWRVVQPAQPGSNKPTVGGPGLVAVFEVRRNRRRPG